jgi:acyl-CoA reductase-like NAD-dependent aldehyde dehydrogenase
MREYGDPFDPRNHMGTVIDEASAANSRRVVNEAVEGRETAHAATSQWRAVFADGARPG